MKNKLLILCTIISLTSPSIAVSCQKKYEIRNDLREHEYLIDKKIQDSKSRIHLISSEIKRKDINSLPISLNGFYNSPLISGGYGETRQFYSSGNSFQRHNGVDVLTYQKTAILAPSSAEIIGAYWLYNPSEWASGIGGVVSYRVKIKDLNIPKELKEFIYIKKGRKYYKVPKASFSSNGIYVEPIIKGITVVTKNDYDKYLSKFDKTEKKDIQSKSNYVYMQAMHLSSDSVNYISKDVKKVTNPSNKKTVLKIAIDIDINNPKEIKKGEIMGFVGSPNDNGGWSSHVHINAYSVLSRIVKRWDRYIIDYSTSDSKLFLKRGIMNSSGYFLSNKETTEEENINYFKSRGNFDPNEIYNFYQKNDKKIVLKIK